MIHFINQDLIYSQNTCPGKMDYNFVSGEKGILFGGRFHRNISTRQEGKSQIQKFQTQQ